MPREDGVDGGQQMVFVVMGDGQMGHELGKAIEP